ncbi:MAG: hypothetical protein MPJ50_05060 [Pirellulales bacterium]|nr:hypothetical protein [Pirellulales bacterium]
MRRLSFIYLLSLLSLLLSAPSAFGQPVRSVRESLQSMLAQADIIVLGEVQGIEAIARRGFWQVELKVHETLQGECPEVVTYICNDEGQLPERTGESLFMLKRSPGRYFQGGNRHRYLTRHPWSCHRVISFEKNETLLSFDERGLVDVAGRAAVLDVARHYVKHRQQDPPAQVVEVLEQTAAAVPGWGPSVAIPLDARLWSTAEIWELQGGKAAAAAASVKENVTKIIGYEAAKEQYALPQQVPTQRRWANILSLDSLETMAADCDLIVRGEIDDLTLVQLGRETKDNWEEALDMHFVRLRVEESLKGTAGETISFYVENGGPLSAWQEQGTQIVVFLRDRFFLKTVDGTHLGTKPPFGSLNVLRYSARAPGVHGLIALGESHPKMYSSSLEWLEDPIEMTGVVRQYLNEVPAAGQSGVLATGRFRDSLVRKVPGLDFSPKAFLADTRWEDVPNHRHLRVNFPIDSNLEKRAKQWVTSPDKTHRWLGAYALLYFKSQENVEILKSLLDGEGQWDQPVKVEGLGFDPKRYLVRAEAWLTLTAWGYHVEQPEFND